jgi:hypothetical protein
MQNPRSDVLVLLRLDCGFVVLTGFGTAFLECGRRIVQSVLLRLRKTEGFKKVSREKKCYGDKKSKFAAKERGLPV